MPINIAVFADIRRNALMRVTQLCDQSHRFSPKTRLSYPELSSWCIKEPLPATPFMAGSGGGWIVMSWVVMDRPAV